MEGQSDWPWILVPEVKDATAITPAKHTAAGSLAGRKGGYPGGCSFFRCAIISHPAPESTTLSQL